MSLHIFMGLWFASHTQKKNGPSFGKKENRNARQQQQSKHIGPKVTQTKLLTIEKVASAKNHSLAGGTKPRQCGQKQQQFLRNLCSKEPRITALEPNDRKIKIEKSTNQKQQKPIKKTTQNTKMLKSIALLFWDVLDILIDNKNSAGAWP